MSDLNADRPESRDRNPNNAQSGRELGAAHPNLNTPTSVRSTLLARDYFAGHVEDVFGRKMGMAEPRLHDYLTDMMVRFIRSEAAESLRGLDGKPLTELIGMLNEARQREGSARLKAYIHIGEVSAFTLGITPHAIEKLKSQGKRDSFIDFREQGRRAYGFASELDARFRAPESNGLVIPGVYRQVHDHWEGVLYGLSEVKLSIEAEAESLTERKLLLR